MTAEKLEFAGHQVVVDSENLKFNEMTLNEYIQKESGYYDNFGGYLAMAEKNQQNKEMIYEKMFAQCFVEAKESGGSDKLAEAKAKCDSAVVSCKGEVIDAKYVVNRLKQHMKAWDKNHDNAQSLGHMLRKQIDKLHGDIMLKGYNQEFHGTPGLDNAIDSTVGNMEDQASESDGPLEFSSDLNIDDLM